jgi:IPT/TIG domain
MKTRLCQFNRTTGDALSFPWWRPLTILLLLWVQLASVGLGQTKVWDRTYGGNHLDALASLQQTSDGGYILGGSSFSGLSDDKTAGNKGQCDVAFCTNDYWIVKLDADGNKVWDKTLGGDQTDFLAVVLQTGDGGYLLGGYSNSGISGDKTADSRGSYDFWVVKLNAAGDKEWDKTLGSNGAEEFTALQQTRDGGYILGGSSPSRRNEDKTENSKGRHDYWVVKLDATGQKEWDRVYGGSEDDKLTALQQTHDGGYILGGFASSNRSGDKSEDIRGTFDYWVVKIDAAGNKQWDKTVGGDKTDILAAVVQTGEGGYLLGGYSASNAKGDKSKANKGNNDYWVIKLDEAGNKQWDKTLGGSEQDILTALQSTPDGGYILGGYSASGAGNNKTQPNQGLADQWVVRLDSAGTQLWDRTFGGSAFDGLAAVRPTVDGGYILGGSSESNPSGDKTEAGRGRTDYWVVKITGAVPPPQLESFSPTQGLPGTIVTITGKNLGTTRAVRFMGLKSEFEVVSDEVVRATVPAQAVSGKITIETAGGKVNYSPPFTVLQPEIAAFVPFQGSVGSRVYLAGQRLSTAKDVYFNGIKSPKVKVYFDWAISAIVPEGATTGQVRVVLNGGGSDITKSEFTVTTSPAPLLPSLPMAQEEPPAKAEMAVPRVVAFPNPFHQQVSFSFTLAQPQLVVVKVYDILGREVSLLYRGQVQARQANQVEWRPGAQQPAGLYIIRLQAPGQDFQKKVILTR